MSSKFLKHVSCIYLFGLTIFIFATAALAWDGKKLERSEKEWLEFLGPERFRIMRKKGTERAFVGKYSRLHQQVGTYYCAACDLSLFHRNDQYDIKGAYPNFKQPISSKHIYYEEDKTLSLKRYEVLCRKCDSHLGHVFKDGPPPKYFRYCINSIALNFKAGDGSN